MSTKTASADSALPPLVWVVDDDASIRFGLDSLFRSVGLRVQTFGSVAELRPGDEARCLVLDVRLPGLSGLDFQSQAECLGLYMPIIFMTGHGDIPMTVRAMKNGAVDFLAKPFRDQDMLDAVNAALAREAERRRQIEALSGIKSRFATLSPREQEIMAHVTAGLMNKQIAGAIGLSEITVKIHRGNAMRKMKAKSLAELVLQAQILGLHSADRG